MSAEATAAVLQHAEGTDAEWRMLAVLANEANAVGVVSGVGMAEIAARVGKKEKGAGQVKGRLIEKGVLVVLDEGGGRGKTATYWIKLPGLPGPEPEKPPAEKPGKGAGTPPASGGNRRRRSSTGTTSTSSSSENEAAFLEELRDVDAPGEMIADAKALLREKRKVGSKIVTPAEMARAVAGLATFNRCFEWNGKDEADFGLGKNLTSIVMRIRDRPTWDPAKHVRLVESAWRIRWWERTGQRRRPEPNVVYGAKVFDKVAQDAKEEKESGGIDRPARKYTRRNRG